MVVHTVVHNNTVCGVIIDVAKDSHETQQRLIRVLRYFVDCDVVKIDSRAFTRVGVKGPALDGSVRCDPLRIHVTLSHS
jgi:hypothetical protein